MATFEFELWRYRAELKRDRLRHQRLKTKAHNQFIQDINAIDGLNRTVEWCIRQGIVVAFTNTTNGTWFASEKKIEIAGSAKPESQLFWLLHECGHYLSPPHDEAKAKRKIKERLRKSLIQRTNIVEEEFIAWNNGLSLAKRLGININTKRWIERRAEALNTYFKWVVTTNA